MSEEAGRVDLETPDLAAEKRAAFEDLYPGVLADGVLDATRLGELLDTPVTAPADGRERFGLMWAGKQEAVRSLLTPSHGGLIPDLDRSIGFDAARNVFIEGDNLEVLKLLQKAYNDRVKLIYIDPPYNTGNDFVYEDDFSDGLRRYLEYTGQLDERGSRTSANVDVVGRRHSRWLSMMYPRLVLGRNLLSQDGVLAVSIDDNEVASLRQVLDEIFGPENFLNTFVWVSNLKGRQISGTGAAATKEYIHVYARDVERAGEFRASAALLKSLMPSAYKGFNYEVQSDEHGPYVLKNELHNTNSAFNEVTRPNLVYDIYFDPNTRDVQTAPVSEDHVHDGYVKISPKTNNNGVNRYHAFRWSRGKVAAESHNLEFVEAASGYKVFTKVRDVDSTALKDIAIGISTTDGSADLKTLGIDPTWFDHPKPARLLQVLVAAATNRDSLVLDFFAGSGSTAHAVALQNQADDGWRTVISVNLPEPLPDDAPAKKAGLEVVSDITRERLIAITTAGGQIDGLGLRSFSLSSSNFHSDADADAKDLLELRPTTLRVAGEVTDAIAAEVLLQEGVPLDVTWERASAGGAPVITAGGVAVVLSIDITDEVVDDALALETRVVVFLEDGFAGADALKANAVTSARNRGITLKTV
mgnify:CR=1 FL=1